MKIQRFIILIILITGIFSGSTGAQIIVSENKSSQLGDLARVGQELTSNLQYFSSVYECTVGDSLFRDSLALILGKKVMEQKPELLEYDNLQWVIRNSYAIGRYKNFFILNLQDPEYNQFSYKFLYNKAQDEYYLLGHISVKEINSIFSTEKPLLRDDQEILLFCWFITAFKHSSVYVRFIGDIKELLLEAVTGPRFKYYDLEGIKPFLHIEVELPIIIKEKDDIFISYYFAKHDQIMKAIVKFKGSSIISYEEEKIGEVPMWYGYNRLW
jgi:hypothetical protein